MKQKKIWIYYFCLVVLLACVFFLEEFALHQFQDIGYTLFWPFIVFVVYAGIGVLAGIPQLHADKRKPGRWEVGVGRCVILLVTIFVYSGIQSPGFNFSSILVAPLFIAIIILSRVAIGYLVMRIAYKKRQEPEEMLQGADITDVKPGINRNVIVVFVTGVFSLVFLLSVVQIAFSLSPSASARTIVGVLLICGTVFGIIGLIAGIITRKKVLARFMRGKHFTTAGIACSIITVVLGVNFLWLLLLQ